MPKRPFVPGFLKKLDDYLLINRPAAWSARTHLAVWYAFLFAVVLTLFCFIVPFDARQRSEVSSWVMFVVVIIIISLIIWLIYLLRFNVFKKFGRLPAGYGLMTFFLYAIVVGSFIAWAYIPAAVESIRANRAYTNAELLRDVNTVNLDLCKLERDSLLLDWTPDTAILRKYMPPEDRTTEETEVDAVTEDHVAPSVDTMAEPDNSARVVSNIDYYTYKDSAKLFERVRNTDSLVRPNDSTYVFYECPDYHFINDYSSEFISGFIGKDDRRMGELSSVDIYNKVLKNYRRPDRRAIRKEYDSLVAKYNTDELRERYVREVFPRHYRFNRKNYLNHTQEKYGTYVFGGAMMNITDKKYRWQKDVLSDFVRPFYYIVLVITLLVFIFRHTTIKTFFLSILTAIILLILTSLVFVLFSLHSDRGVYWVMLSYYLLFAIVAFTIATDVVRRAWKGIALNLFVFFMPYIPLICVAQYYWYLRENYESYLHPKLFEHKEFHLLLGEIGGFVLLLVLLELVIRPLYRKWYSLPGQ